MKSRKTVRVNVDAMQGDVLLEAIALEILGWKVAKGAAPEDANGGNGGDLLTPDGTKEAVSPCNYLPLGRISRVYHVPGCTREFTLALMLAVFVKLPDPACKLPLSPEAIARRCLAYWRAERRKPSPVPYRFAW